MLKCSQWCQVSLYHNVTLVYALKTVLQKIVYFDAKLLIVLQKAKILRALRHRGFLLTVCQTWWQWLVCGWFQTKALARLGLHFEDTNIQTIQHGPTHSRDLCLYQHLRMHTKHACNQLYQTGSWLSHLTFWWRNSPSPWQCKIRPLSLIHLAPKMA